MTKSVLLLVSILLVMACDACASLGPVRTGANGELEPVRAAPEQMAAAAKVEIVCNVEAPDGRKIMRIWTGSGVVVAPRVMLTAYHVVNCEGMILINVILPDGQEINARVRDFAAHEDVARLDLDADVENYTPISLGPVPMAGDSLCVASGTPDRDLRCGNFIRIRKDGRMYFSNMVRPGNSGSGMYNSDGRLVGVVTHLMKCPNGQYCGGLASYARVWMP